MLQAPPSKRGKAEPSAHEFKSPTTATHSPRLVHPSNPLPWRIADTKQMCCVLSCHDTELLKETLRTQRFSLNLIFNTTWYLINCRIMCNGNVIILWQNVWVLTLSRCLSEVGFTIQFPQGLAYRKSDSGLVFLVMQKACLPHHRILENVPDFYILDN